MRNRLAVIAVSVTTASLVATGTAAAGDYPAKVEKQFNSSCVAAAQKKGATAPKKKLRKVCNYTLTCIEGKLTLKEFSNAKANDPAIKSCIKKAKKHFS